MSSATLLDIAMNHSEKLIHDAQQGDRKAFNKLVSLWYKRIYNFSHKYFNDHDMATEVSQRTFISLFSSLPKLQEVASFKPWLYKIALNTCRDEERKASSRSRLVVSHGGDSESVAHQVPDHDNPAPDKLFMQHQVSELVLGAIEQLSEEQREVLIMKEYEGFKFREIAEVIGVSENTVKSRLYYGLSNLKKIIEKERVYKESVNYGN